MIATTMRGQIAVAASLIAVLLGSGCGSSAGGGTTYRVPSSAMEPTLKVGASVRVDTNAFRHANPQVGDIVAFHPPRGADSPLPVCGASREGQGSARPCGVPTSQQSNSTSIKRVVAGPGDRIAIVDGHVVRNGVREREPYVTQPCGGDALCAFPEAIVVAPGYYFMLGDNRRNSSDSRFWGPVPARWIIGKVLH
jgi:signal peptidase I